MDTALELPAPLTPAQVAAVEAAILDARSPNTRRAYQSALRQFEAWCMAAGQPFLPTNPAALAAHLVERHTAGISSQTLAVTLAAVRAAHLDAGHRDPTSHRGVTTTMAGLRRRPAAPAKKARAFTMAELRRIIAGIEDDAAGRRDRAIILVAFASACRRSELVGLDRGDVELTAEGARLTLRRSKGDQDGRGQVVGFPPGHGATDPVRALRQWLVLSGPGAVFKRVTRTGAVLPGRLSGAAVNDVLRARAAAAGVDVEGLTAHSTRTSHVTAAAQAGVPLQVIQAQTRHANLQTLSGYIRDARAVADSSAGSLGL